jgi:pimeloyl-ACP methyl ester carboxylesterase
LPQLMGREILIQFIEAHMEFSPVSVIHKKGNRPLMLIAAELDVVAPMKDYKKLYDKAPEPKQWLVFEKTRHFEFYQGKAAERSASEAVNFFKEHLVA